MNRVYSSRAKDAAANAYRVELPRVSDAVERSLRQAYQREPALPEDMRRALRRLDQPEAPH
jgi:hypothetical protein